MQRRSATGGSRWGMSNSVPAGKYGKAALEKLGVWNAVSNKLAQAESVRAALLLVSRGEAPLGIVYKTDAASDPNVRIVATFPAELAPANHLSGGADGKGRRCGGCLPRLCEIAESCAGLRGSGLQGAD